MAFLPGSVFRGWQIKMKECSVQFGPQQKAALLIPGKGLARVAKTFGIGTHVIRGIDKFENARPKPASQRLGSIPGKGLPENFRRQNSYLHCQIKIEICAANLEARKKITGKTG